jgi:hypothetical protein
MPQDSVEGGGSRRWRDRVQLGFLVGGIAEGKFIRLQLQEEVERIDHIHLDREIDTDSEDWSPETPPGPAN